MDFWSKMLSNIADAVLPKDLDDDALLMQMDEALQEEKSLWHSQQQFLDPCVVKNFQENGIRHIVLRKRKHMAYYSLLVYLAAKFAMLLLGLLKFMSSSHPNCKHITTSWQVKKRRMQRN